MVTGAYRTVGEGRAEIRIGEFHEQPREDRPTSAQAVDVQISCAEETRSVTLVAGATSDEVCDVRVQLLEIVTWRPPRARFRVLWEE